MSQTKKTKKNSGRRTVRQARFSIAGKLGVFSAVLLIVVLLIVGTFIVHQQESVQQDNITTSLRGYFATFRATVIKAISEDQDQELISRYVRSMTNIPNLQSAMFVNRNNYVFASVYHRDQEGVYASSPVGGWSSENLLPRFQDPKLQRRYGDLNYFWNSVADDQDFVSVNAIRFPEETHKKMAESIEKTNDYRRKMNKALVASNRRARQKYREKNTTLNQEAKDLNKQVQDLAKKIQDNEKVLQASGTPGDVQRKLRRENRKMEQTVSKLERKIEAIEKEKLELSRKIRKSREEKPGLPLLPKPTRNIRDSFMPVYYNFFQEKVWYDKTLANIQTLYRSWKKQDFSFPWMQSKERRQDLAFLEELEAIYQWLYPVDRVVRGREIRKMNRNRVKTLARRDENTISYSQVYRLHWYMVRARRYRKGLTGISYFTRSVVMELADILEKFRGRRLTDTQKKLLELARQGDLFQKSATVREREAIKTAQEYMQLAETFTENVFGDDGQKWRREALEDAYSRRIRPFERGGDQLFYEIRYCKESFEAFLKEGKIRLHGSRGRAYQPYYSPRLNRTFISKEDYLPQTIRDWRQGTFNISIFERFQNAADKEKLKRYYTKNGRVYNLVEGLTEAQLATVKKLLEANGFVYLDDAASREEYVQHAFRMLLAPFKFGFIRIALSTDRIEEDLRQTRMRTIDISISLLVRLIFFSFLLSAVMVRNIRKVTAGVEAVGAGNFDTRIDVRSRDELGQLADRFNVMAGNLKEGFRMHQELMDAQQIQKFLIPENEEFPDIPGFSFAGYYVAQTEAGGDYYDVLDTVGEDSFGLISADVSGHGVASGLVMTMVRSVLHAKAPGESSAARVLCKVNPQIHRDTRGPLYATAFYAVVNTKTGKMSYACAGHNPAILVNPETKEIKYLEGAGIPLGWMPASTFDGILKGYTVQLQPGFVLLMYTDGLTEAMNEEREEYEEERLIRAVKKHAGKPLNKFLDALVADMQAFTGGLPQEDDISLLAIKMEKE